MAHREQKFRIDRSLFAEALSNRSASGMTPRGELESSDTIDVNALVMRWNTRTHKLAALLQGQRAVDAEAGHSQLSSSSVGIGGSSSTTNACNGTAAASASNASLMCPKPMPDFSEMVAQLTLQVETHRKHAASARQLNERLRDTIASLHESIAQLKQRVDRGHQKRKSFFSSPAEVQETLVGRVGNLIPPTPAAVRGLPALYTDVEKHLGAAPPMDDTTMIQQRVAAAKAAAVQLFQPRMLSLLLASYAPHAPHTRFCARVRRSDARQADTVGKTSRTRYRCLWYVLSLSLSLCVCLYWRSPDRTR